MVSFDLCVSSVISELLCSIFSIKHVGVWPGGQTGGSQRLGRSRRIGSLLIAGATPQEGIQVQATEGSHSLSVNRFTYHTRTSRHDFTLEVVQLG